MSAKEEWTFVAAYLVLSGEDAGQRPYPLREVFDGLRDIVKIGAHWRMMPHGLPPWPVVYQQMRRWMAAGCFETIVADLRILLRRAAARPHPPTAAILDSRTLQSTLESGARAGYDGAKQRRGSKVPAAVDTLGQVLALVVTPADEQVRAHVEVCRRAGGGAEACAAAGRRRSGGGGAVLRARRTVVKVPVAAAIVAP
jgi:transposase